MIKEKTPQDTIINSWWDFGDWFKTVGNRRVIFDGQSQNFPQAYWMAKVILGNNEEEAVAILRMLNNGGNRAFEVIDEYIKDPLQSVLLLESVLTYDLEHAKAKLLDFLPEPAVNEVIKLIFSKSGRAVFVVDPSMQGKIVAISYLGDWNFSKVYMAQKFNKMEKDQILEHLKKLGRNPAVMQQLYQEVFLIAPGSLENWISKRLQFYSGLANGQEKDGLVFFEHGFIYNPKDQTIQTNNGQIPRSLFVLINGMMTEMVFPNANVVFSCLVVKTDQGYKSVLLDRELANSMFVRMFYFNGMGLKHFLPYIESQSGSEFIRVFTVVW
jgi:dolichyl-diphosphooligosaccharide--protein glycosyltransferase